MGLDMLDMTFHLERTHHLHLSLEGAFRRLEITKDSKRQSLWRGYRCDWKVGTFFECIRPHFYYLWPTCQEGAAPRESPPRCRKCGNPLSPADLTFEQLVDALHAVTRKNSITKDLWLRTDLDFI
jgi:hypothetical protein